MSADLLDVFGRNSGDKISSDTPPSILSPSICVNPVMETSKVSEDDFDLVYYNDANKGKILLILGPLPNMSSEKLSAHYCPGLRFS